MYVNKKYLSRNKYITNDFLWKGVQLQIGIDFCIIVVLCRWKGIDVVGLKGCWFYIGGEFGKEQYYFEFIVVVL